MSSSSPCYEILGQTRERKEPNVEWPEFKGRIKLGPKTRVWSQGEEEDRTGRNSTHSINAPQANIVIPIMLTIQWMLGRAVQANKNSPTGNRTTANSAGTSRCSCARRPFFLMSGSR